MNRKSAKYFKLNNPEKKRLKFSTKYNITCESTSEPDECERDKLLNIKGEIHTEVGLEQSCDGFFTWIKYC